MRKFISIFSILFFLFGFTARVSACSPTEPTIEDLIEDYNRGYLAIVEGYFVPNDKGSFTSKFVVTRTSDSTIKIGQEYQVYEYGPFGSQCEMYEMENSIRNIKAGEDKPRLLFIYKKRSKNGKLVTPIFWGRGMPITMNTISRTTREYDREVEKRVYYQYSTSLDAFWQQIESRKTLDIKWEKEEVKK